MHHGWRWPQRFFKMTNVAACVNYRQGTACHQSPSTSTCMSVCFTALLKLGYDIDHGSLHVPRQCMLNAVGSLHIARCQLDSASVCYGCCMQNHQCMVNLHYSPFKFAVQSQVKDNVTGKCRFWTCCWLLVCLKTTPCCLPYFALDVLPAAPFASWRLPSGLTACHSHPASC